MSSINIKGVLRNPNSDVSFGNLLKLTHVTTTGETVAGFGSSDPIEINGAYDIDIEYGNVFIETYDKVNARWKSHGVRTINSETPATTLTELIGITTPLTDPQLLLVQNLVADSVEAKNSAELAQSATESLFNDFNNNVYEAVGAAAVVEPDFKCSFGDSLRVEKGLSYKDTIDVSAGQNGSLMVELPSSSVGFSRNNSIYDANKSGVLTEFKANEPIVNENGAYFHDAFINYCLYSGDVTKSSWGKLKTSVELVVDNSFLFGSYSKATPNTENGSHYVTQSLALDTLTEYSFSILLKADGINSVRFVRGGSGWEQGGSLDLNLLTGETSSASEGVVKSMGNGWFEASIQSISSDIGGNGGLLVLALSDSGEIIFASDGEKSYLIGYGQMTKTPQRMPYVKTEATATATARSVAFTPLNGNLPYQGGNFAIKVNGLIPNDKNGGESVVFRQGRTTNRGMFMRRQSGLIHFGLSDGVGVFSCSFADEIKQKNYVCRYQNGLMSLFVSGYKVSEVSISNVVYSLNELLNFGGDSSFSLNGGLKDIEFFIGDVSDETILMWG